MLLIAYTLFALLCWWATGAISDVSPLILLIAYSGWALLYLAIIRRRSEVSYCAAMGVAVFLRCLFVFLPVVLTGDIPRYLWEGMLVREGVSPYAFAPSSPELGFLHTYYHSDIEYPHLSAIYPPLAIFLLAIFAKSLFIWKLFITALDFINLYLLSRLLRQRKLPDHNLFIYALLPLPVIEIAGSGHLEGVLITCMLLALVTTRDSLKGLFYGAGMLVKYNLFLAFAYECYLRMRAKDFKGVLCLTGGLLVCVVLLFLPFREHLPDVFRSLSEYVQHWRFNDSLLHLTGELVGVDWQDVRTFTWIKIALLGVWAALLMPLVWTRKTVEEFLVLAYGTYLLLSAVVHPWYGLWFASLLALVPVRAFILFALTLPISYVSRISGELFIQNLFQLIEYVPVYALILLPRLRSLVLPLSSEKR